MGDSSYPDERRRTLGEIRAMIEGTAHEPWSICLQHESAKMEEVASRCQKSGRALAGCLADAVQRLEQGEPLDAICDVQAADQLQRIKYPQTAAGGRASAIGDVSLLIVSLDPIPFMRTGGSTINDDVQEYLNSTLHGWLLQLQRQWRMNGLHRVVANSMLSHKIPAPEREKATPLMALRLVRHIIPFMPPQPSPLKNKAALAFANTFRFKLWPHLRELPPGPPQGCQLGALSAPFQEWYFGVGRTQHAAATPKSQREAEDIFATVRDQFHARARRCAGPAQSGCAGQCVHDSFAAVADHPFKQRCEQAVRHIRLHLTRSR